MQTEISVEQPEEYRKMSDITQFTVITDEAEVVDEAEEGADVEEAEVEIKMFLEIPSTNNSTNT